MKFIDKIEDVYRYLKGGKNFAYTFEDLLISVPFLKKSQRSTKYDRQDLKKILKILAFGRLIAIREQDNVRYFMHNKDGSTREVYKAYEMNRWQSWKTIDQTCISKMLSVRGLVPEIAAEGGYDARESRPN
jgi:hypothetical protein